MPLCFSILNQVVRVHANNLLATASSAMWMASLTLYCALCRTEVASKQLETCLTQDKHTAGSNRVRRKKRAPRATRAGTAPADLSSGQDRGGLVHSAPATPQHRPSPKASSRLGEPVMRAIPTPQTNPLSSGGFPGWKTLPQSASSPHRPKPPSRHSRTTGSSHPQINMDGDVIRVTERGRRATSVPGADKFLSPWNTDPEEIFAGL